MSLKEQIAALVADLKTQHDFDDEFYTAYTGGGDISDWHCNHFDDNVDLGYSTGQTAATEDIIGQLEAILND